MTIKLTDILDLAGFALLAAGVAMKYGAAESMMVSGALILSVSLAKVFKGDK